MEDENLSLATRKILRKKRNRLIRMYVILFLTAAFVYVILSYGVNNFRTNPKLVALRRQDQTWVDEERNDDGSLKSSRVYKKGHLTYEYEDLGDRIRETRYIQQTVSQEAGDVVISSMQESDKDGNLILSQSYKLGFLIQECEYEQGKLVRVTDYYGSKYADAADDGIWYSSYPEEWFHRQEYDSEGKLTYEEDWSSDRSQRTIDQYGQEHSHIEESYDKSGNCVSRQEFTE